MTPMNEQGSKQWHDSRGGMITASMVHRILGGTKQLETVRNEIRQWRKTGKAPPGFTSVATDWGNTYESAALANAMVDLGVDIRSCGQVVHPEFAYVGASPDGLGNGFGVEAKCPHNPENHLAHLDVKAIPKAYQWQMQCGMWCTGLDEWLFISYDPRRLIDGLDDYLITHWIPKSPKMIATLETRVPWFWKTI